MNRYEPGTPRALISVAAICMTVATFVVSAHLPAVLDSGNREGVLTMSNEPQSHAHLQSGPLTTSIDVVAYRSTRRAPVVQTRAQARNGVSG